MGSGRPIKRLPSPQPPRHIFSSFPFCFFLHLSVDRKAMSGEAEVSLSGTSTTVSVFRGAVEAPSEAGARVAEHEEVVSRPAVVRDLSRLAVITGPATQAEARARDTWRAHVMSTFKERTAGIPGLSPL